MLSASGLLVLATALAALAVPAAPAAPAPDATAAPASPLREIGHVRATTPLCAELASDAARAIDRELDADLRIGGVEVALRGADFDGNEVVKARNTQDVRARYVALRASVVDARRLMKSFRTASAGAPSDEQRIALTTFANALDGALHRQESLADAVGRFVAFLDTHAPIDDIEHEQTQISEIASANVNPAGRSPFDARAFGPDARVAPQLSTIAKAAATLLVERSAPLASDEQTAADRIDPAFAGC